jgi:hypothetical protein
MSGDDYEITVDDARAVARRVVSADGVSQPLVGKETELFETLLGAQRVHDEALEIDSFRRVHPGSVSKLRKALQNALDALDKTDVNLALCDPDLDESFTDPNSRRDLRGLLRRALEGIDKIPYDLDRRDLDGKLPRAVRSHPDNINSVGIRAVVGILFDFWDRETGLPFSDDFEKPLDDRGEDAALKPKGLAAKLVGSSQGSVHVERG